MSDGHFRKRRSRCGRPRHPDPPAGSSSAVTLSRPVTRGMPPIPATCRPRQPAACRQKVDSKRARSENTILTPQNARDGRRNNCGKLSCASPSSERYWQHLVVVAVIHDEDAVVVAGTASGFSCPHVRRRSPGTGQPSGGRPRCRPGRPWYDLLPAPPRGPFYGERSGRCYSDNRGRQMAEERGMPGELG